MNNAIPSSQRSLMGALGLVLMLVLLASSCDGPRDDRQRRWDESTPDQRFRDGLRGRNPPGRGFNTEE